MCGTVLKVNMKLKVTQFNFLLAVPGLSVYDTYVHIILKKERKTMFVIFIKSNLLECLLGKH